MATTFSSNYYPPIVDTYLPAFEVDDNGNFAVRIYFQLSPYTDFLHSKYVHVKVVDQRTNKSMLKYARDLKVNAVTEVDLEKDGDDKYYITLTQNDFKDFDNKSDFLYKYYKVQLRTAARQISADATLSTVLNTVYSEWSTVCLIMGIKKPKLYLKYFHNMTSTQQVSFLTDTVVVNGYMLFDDEVGEDSISSYSELNSKVVHTTENIKSYRIKFYDKDDLLIDDSGILYPPVTDLRLIKYDCQYLFSEPGMYHMTVAVQTTSYYDFTETFNFFIAKQQDETISLFYGYIQPLDELGAIQVEIETSTEAIAPDTDAIIYIRRADSTTNFKQWKDVFIKSVSVDEIQSQINSDSEAKKWILEWKDYTIESGIWYNYSFQYITNATGGVRTKNKILKIKKIQNSDSVMQYKTGDITDEQNIMLIFDDCFLIGQNGQCLKITYDNAIDSLKYSQYISKVDTIGSKYPFIRQNSATCYRTFQLSGIITYLANTQNSFITDDKLFLSDDIVNLYQEYNDKNNITSYNDYIKEREFREAVMNFLIADDVKLFKSTTEGNILVKLLDVNFTPKQELGRYIYSFSATAVECGECSIDNFKKYNIQHQGDVLYKNLFNTASIYKVTTYTYTANGFKINNITVTDQDNLKNLLINEYWDISNPDEETVYYIKDENDNLVETDDETIATLKSSFVLSDIQPYFLQIEFLDLPYPIDGVSKEKVLDNGDYVGWRFDIVRDDNNKEKYIITTNAHYYIFESDIPLTFKAINFPYGGTINVSVNAKLIYEKKIYEKQNSSGDWEIIDEDDMDNPTPVSPVFYQDYTLYNLFNDNFNWQDGVNTDLITVIKNRDDLIPDNTILADLEVFGFKVQDFPQGAIFQIKYNSTATPSMDYLIISSSGSLDLNLSDNTSDSFNTLKEVYLKGQLISTDNDVTENYLLSDERLNLKDGNWCWTEGAIDYPVSLYSNLAGFYNGTSINDKANAKYGVIWNYIVLNGVSQISFIMRADWRIGG